MKTEPRGLTAVFKVTKTYYVTVDGYSEDDVWCRAEELSNTDISEDDFADMEIDIKDGFEYEWNGTRLYFPDFYLPAFDLYVEVKGFETDRDQAKWSAFPHKLGIVRKNEIKQIENDLFNIESIM
jgi:hypothetical protein